MSSKHLGAFRARLAPKPGTPNSCIYICIIYTYICTYIYRDAHSFDFLPGPTGVDGDI